jgi:hypothetical protein
MLLSPSTACDTTIGRTPEIICDLGALTNWTLDDTINVKVPVIANSSTSGSLVNSATITANAGNQTVNSTANATVSVTVNNATTPTLEVTKTGPGASVRPGEVFTFNVTAGVARDGPVNPVFLVDELQSTYLKFEAPIPAGG